MRTVLAFVAAAFRQLARDRTALFFTVALPVLLITILGVTFGGSRAAAVGVVEGADPGAVAALDADDRLRLVTFGDDDALRSAVRTQRIDLGLRFGDDRIATLSLPDSAAGRAAVGVVADVLDGGGSGVPVEVVADGRFQGNSDFALVSAQELVLFAFITALTSAATIVVARENGVLRRVLSGPVGGVEMVLGLAGTWFAISLLQSVLVLAVGGIGFGVDWGDPLAALALLLSFSAVGAGAGLLGGAAFASRDQADSAAAPIALVLAALGGCMVPAEIFPAGLDTASRFTPHRWAVDGWLDVVFSGAGLTDIGANVGVLVIYAAALAALGGWLLRRRVTA